MPEKKKPITYQIRLKFDLYNYFMDLADFSAQGSNPPMKKRKGQEE